VTINLRKERELSWDPALGAIPRAGIRIRRKVEGAKEGKVSAMSRASSFSEGGQRERKRKKREPNKSKNRGYQHVRSQRGKNGTYGERTLQGITLQRHLVRELSSKQSRRKTREPRPPTSTHSGHPFESNHHSLREAISIKKTAKLDHQYSVRRYSRGPYGGKEDGVGVGGKEGGPFLKKLLSPCRRRQIGRRGLPL